MATQTSSLLLILGGALFLLIIAGIVLSRSWGNFPTRIKMPSNLEQSGPPRRTNTPLAQAVSDDQKGYGFASDGPPTFADQAKGYGFASDGPPAVAEQQKGYGFASDQAPTVESSTVFGFGSNAAPSDSAEVPAGLVPVTHPLLRQAMEQALQKGAPQASHLMRQGDRIYINLDSIPDPEQRRKAYTMLMAFQGGPDGKFSLRETLELIRQLG